MEEEDFQRFQCLFQSFDTDHDGYLTGKEARGILYSSGLAKSVLAYVWDLCDVDCDGAMDVKEFCLAMWLVARKVHMHVELPKTLNLDMKMWLGDRRPASSSAVKSKTESKEPKTVPAPSPAAPLKRDTSRGNVATSQGAPPVAPRGAKPFPAPKQEESSSMTEDQLKQEAAKLAWNHRKEIYAASQTEAGKDAAKMAMKAAK